MYFTINSFITTGFNEQSNNPHKKTFSSSLHYYYSKWKIFKFFLLLCTVHNLRSFITKKYQIYSMMLIMEQIYVYAM